jgi:hypothetical protein
LREAISFSASVSSFTTGADAVFCVPELEADEPELEVEEGHLHF